MSLSNYKINQQLERYIDQFLTSPTPPSFSQLKTLLIARQPIAAIHARIVSEITEIKNRAQLESKSRLEINAIQQQVREDNAEITHDELELSIDQRQRDDLRRELVLVANKLQLLMFEKRSLSLITITSGVNINQHTHPSSDSSSIFAGSIVHSHADAQGIDRLRLETRINAYEQKMIRIEHALSTLQNKQDSIDERRILRSARQYARLLSYVNIKNKLSIEHYDQLLSNIQNENNELEAQCASLIRIAKDTNYPIFWGKLESFLSTGRMSDIESDTLRAIVRLINQCSRYDREAQEIQSELTVVIATIANNQEEKRLKTRRLESLHQVNPEFETYNKRLEEENRALAFTRTENIQKRDKLSTPSLILLASSLVSSTPLILTLTGVIPAILTPALLFTLVSFPATLLAVATIIVGIMAINYAIRSRINTSTIESNQRTIDENIKKMDENRNSIASLEQQVIPGLGDQINVGIRRQQELAIQLERTQDLGAQLLRQATNLEPTSLSQSPNQLFARNPSAPPESEVLGDSHLPPAYSEEGASDLGM